MTTVAATQLGGMNVSLVRNKNQWNGESYEPKTFGSIVLAYLDTANGGPFRSLQIGGKLCSLLSLISGNGQVYKEAAKLFAGGWTMTIVPRVPAAYVEAKNAVASVFDSTSTLPGAFVRKCINAVQESAGFVATVGYASSPFLKLSEKTSQVGNSLFRAAEMTTFVGDSCEMVKSFNDTMKTRTMILLAKAADGVSTEFTSMLADSHKLYMMKTMKAVCSVASFVLGLAFAATGLGVVPGCAIMAASISLTSSLLGAGANLHADSMKYKSIQFYDERHVQPISFNELSSEVASDVACVETLVEPVVASLPALETLEKVVVNEDPFHEGGWTIRDGAQNALNYLKSSLVSLGSV
jgi:hypothetical protein